MKRVIICFSLILTLVFCIPISSNAAGFVPVQGSDSIGYYFTDDANTQYYYNGFVEIGGIVYGFDANGLTNTANKFDKNDPTIQAILTTSPAQIFGQNIDIVLYDGVKVSTAPVTNEYGTFQMVDAKASHDSRIAYSTSSYKFTFQSNGKYDTGYCHLKYYDADGFPIFGGGIVKATKDGLNTETGFYPDGTARIEFIK